MSPRNSVLLMDGSRVMLMIESDPGLNRIYAVYSRAQVVMEFLDPDLEPDAVGCPIMSALVTSALVAFDIEHPEIAEELIDADWRVTPAVLAFLKDNLPPGESAESKKLRELILAA